MRKARALAAVVPSLARRRVLLGLVAATSIAAFATGWARAQNPPTTATIEFHGGAVAVGVGFSWGGGTLTYNGKKYPIGATVAGGASVSSMKNDKGVLIEFNTTRAGLQFTVAPKGATIKLKK